MSREILDCLKRERDICVKSVIHCQNTAFMFTPALSKTNQRKKAGNKTIPNEVSKWPKIHPQTFQFEKFLNRALHQAPFFQSTAEGLRVSRNILLKYTSHWQAENNTFINYDQNHTESSPGHGERTLVLVWWFANGTAVEDEQNEPHF